LKRVAVIGAGWAGLAAAVRLLERGHAVTLYEMARHLGGRARSVEYAGRTLDNGQHILIGAYARTLALMRTVGVDPGTALMRTPLVLASPDGVGLRLGPGNATAAFVRATLAQRGWRRRDRIAMLWHAAAWAVRGFRCNPLLTVEALCRGMPAALRRDLIDPLCVAALNTPSGQASAAVFLRVLRDALFGGPGSADLLLPRQPLGDLLPEAAQRWLPAHGGAVRSGARVRMLATDGPKWRVDDDLHDACVVACTAAEAARLAAPHAGAWAQQAAALHYEPIITAVIECPGARLAAPMVALAQGPAQFAFDQGAIAGMPGRITLVISGAQPWVDAGREATERALQAQMTDQFPAGSWPGSPTVVAFLTERRATFRCTPGLRRPALHVAPGLVAAGDYVDGPYPATLEGAVRSGEAAAQALS